MVSVERVEMEISNGVLSVSSKITSTLFNVFSHDLGIWYLVKKKYLYKQQNVPA